MVQFTNLDFYFDQFAGIINAMQGEDGRTRNFTAAQTLCNIMSFSPYDQ